MALPLGKLTILVGAGLVGSVLAKEGRIPGVSDFFSGTLKVVLKQLKQDDSPSSSAKPRNDSLLQQVNSLRQELQLLASNRSVTIVTSSSGAGSSRYGIVIIVIVVGYGYIWWKGWKLPDLMFATRRSLSDACASVSKQLESVYSSISATKRHLSSRIDRVDCKIDECAENTATTREEVSGLRGDVRIIGTNVESVHDVVRSLETKISRIEGKQNETNFGLGRLIAFVRSIENNSMAQIEVDTSSSRPALELPQASSSSKVGSLPSNSSSEPPSPSSSSGSVKRPLQTAISASGMKDLLGTSDGSEISSQSILEVSGAIAAPERPSNENSGSGILARRFSGIMTSAIGTAFLTRSRNATQSSK